ncbi:MAG: L,D-transpeptidase [Lachnospiraceae bacterium]|nr:L,D-transpeptidase [Lachnospiraceae bacterium]
MFKKAIKVILIVFGCLILALVLGYAAVSAYFIDKFLYGTTVNGRDVEGMTIEAANDYLVNTYLPGVEYAKVAVLLEGRDGYAETIKGSEFGLGADMMEDLGKIKDSQKPYEWLLYSLYPSEYTASPGISYDRDALYERLSSLDCVGDKSKDADPLVEIRNDNGSYSLYDNIVDHVDPEKLTDKVCQAVDNTDKAVIELDIEDCYEPHVIPNEFDEAVKLYDKIKKIQDSSITFKDAPLQYSLMGTAVTRWLKTDEKGMPLVGEDGNLVFDEDKVNGYTETLSKVFNTTGGTIEWKKKSGEMVSVKNAMPGYVIDKEAEAESIKDTFLRGGSVERSPIYSEKGKGRGQDVVGKTYIEVDMSAQKLYYYVDGRLKLQSDVVTGNVSRGNGTPAKLCYVYFKQKNRTLRGPDYATFVHYWMAVSGHIGIHDATWRGKFGGEIYKTAGSHGCVNVPKDFAAKLYDVVEVGTPCVMYY